MPYHVDLTPDSDLEFCKQLLRQPPGPWPDRWEGFPNIAAAFRQLMYEARDAVPAPPKFPIPRGIVICGGGWKFFPSIYVTVKILRHVGCHLPIQVWYLGDRGEFDIRMQAALANDDVGWIDANAFCREHGIARRILGGWEVKPLAAAYAPFETVLFLDADSYPAYNPEQFLEHPEFQRVGAAFWPDQGRLEPGQWERFGVSQHDEAAWETGQFIVDKSRHWQPLWLTAFMNDFSDYVYRHIYGDKDTFHLCWRLCGHEVCVPTQWPGWDRVAFVQFDFEGRPLFIHRTRDKFRLAGQIDSGNIDQGYMTSQWGAGVQFVETLPHEAFGHAALAECDRLLRPELFFGFRGHTHDRDIWQAVSLYNEYDLPRTISGVVVDIGAHIGSFAWSCLRRGASKVVCYEPYLGSFELLESNLGRFENRFVPRRCGVWGDDLREAPRMLHQVDPAGKNSGDASLLADGAELHAVDLLPISQVLDRAGPVCLLKLDCEGAEWPILFGSDAWRRVPLIVGEYHPVRWRGAERTMEELRERLASAGFQVTTREIVPGQGIFRAVRECD